MLKDYAVNYAVWILNIPQTLMFVKNLVPAGGPVLAVCKTFGMWDLTGSWELYLYAYKKLHTDHGSILSQLCIIFYKVTYWIIFELISCLSISVIFIHIKHFYVKLCKILPSNTFCVQVLNTGNVTSLSRNKLSM